MTARKNKSTGTRGRKPAKGTQQSDAALTQWVDGFNAMLGGLKTPEEFYKELPQSAKEGLDKPAATEAGTWFAAVMALVLQATGKQEELRPEAILAQKQSEMRRQKALAVMNEGLLLLKETADMAEAFSQVIPERFAAQANLLMANTIQTVFPELGGVPLTHQLFSGEALGELPEKVADPQIKKVTGAEERLTSQVTIIERSLDDPSELSLNGHGPRKEKKHE